VAVKAASYWFSRRENLDIEHKNKNRRQNSRVTASVVLKVAQHSVAFPQQVGELSVKLRIFKLSESSSGRTSTITGLNGNQKFVLPSKSLDIFCSQPMCLLSGDEECDVNVCIRFGLKDLWWGPLPARSLCWSMERTFQNTIWVCEAITRWDFASFGGGVKRVPGIFARSPWKAIRFLSKLLLFPIMRVGGHMKKVQLYSKNSHRDGRELEGRRSPSHFVSLFWYENKSTAKQQKISNFASLVESSERSLQKRQKAFSISFEAWGEGGLGCAERMENRGAGKKVHKQVLKTKSSSDSVSSRESPHSSVALAK
jgi:hypothetical protein